MTAKALSAIVFNRVVVVNFCNIFLSLDCTPAGPKMVNIDDEEENNNNYKAKQGQKVLANSFTSNEAAEGE